MTDSLRLIRDRLALIQTGISGIQAAYAEGPYSLPDGDLPLFVNFAGGGDFDFELYGDGVGGEQRTFLMRLYLLPVQEGLPAEAEQLAAPFFNRVRDAFAARPGLQQLAGVQWSRLLGDSGVSVLTYAGQNYIGIEFRLRVASVFDVVYAQGE